MEDPPDYWASATAKSTKHVRRSNRTRTDRGSEAVRTGARGTSHAARALLADSKGTIPGTTFEDIDDPYPPPLIAREIATLKKRLGANYVYPTTSKPQGRNQNTVTVLPCMVGLKAVLELFNAPGELIQTDVLEFMRSGGVLPQLFMWHKQCTQDSRKLIQQLSQKLLLSPWVAGTAQSLARDIANLAELSSDEMEAVQPCEVLLLCAQYTKSLRSKNMDNFFSKHYLSNDTILLICATILLAVYRDHETEPQKGFFATLFRSRLARPMSDDLRKIWEAKYQLPPLTKIESASSRNRSKIPSQKLPQGVETHASTNRLSKQKVTPAESMVELQSVMYAQDVNENPFTDNEKLIYLETFLPIAQLVKSERARLEKILDMETKKASKNKLKEQLESDLREELEKELEEELKKRLKREWQKELSKNRDGWRELEPSLSDALREGLDEKQHVAPLFSFNQVAELLPRRSRQECIQHHEIMRAGLRKLPEDDGQDESALRTPSGVRGGSKRAAPSELWLDHPLRKKSKADATTLSDRTSSPTDSAVVFVGSGYGANLEPPLSDMRTETKEGLKAQLVGTSKALAQERHLRRSSTVVLPEDSTEHAFQLTKELGQLRKENKVLKFEAVESGKKHKKQQGETQRANMALQEELKLARKDLEIACQAIARAKIECELVKTTLDDAKKDADSHQRNIVAMTKNAHEEREARGLAQEAAVLAQEAAKQAARKSLSTDQLTQDMIENSKAKDGEILALQDKITAMAKKATQNFEALKAAPPATHKERFVN